MPYDKEIDRRGFLQFAGVSAAAATTSLAGCTGGEDDGEDPLGEEDQDLEITVTQGQFASTLDPQDHNDTPTYNVLTCSTTSRRSSRSPTCSSATTSR